MKKLVRKILPPRHRAENDEEFENSVITYIFIE